MELRHAVARRRMTRAFTDDVVAPGIIDDLLEVARRAPSAGHTQGVDLVVLAGPDQTRRLWDVSLPGGEAAGAPMPHPRLPSAHAIVVVVTEPGAYLRRYSEADKARAGFGPAAESWPVPYWWVDAGAVIENLLLAVADAELGACLFSVAHVEAELIDALAIPSDRRLVGAVAIGHPAADAGVTGSATRRPWRRLDDVVHRGGW